MTFAFTLRQVGQLLLWRAAIVQTAPADTTKGEISVTVSLILETRERKVITSMPLDNAKELHGDLRQHGTTTTSQMLVGAMELHPEFPRGELQ